MEDADVAPPATALMKPHTFGSGRALRPRTKVLPEQARNHNRALVLQTLFHVGAMSRADLSRETGLTRVTISDLIAELIDDGIVVERGIKETTGPGKPATIVDIDRDGHQIIGIDLSGPGAFVGAVMSLTGEVLHREEADRPPSPQGDVAHDLVEQLALTLVNASTRPLLGLGIATPGVVRPGGVVHSAPNLGWSAHPLERRLRDALRLPVMVRNDANAAVLGEYTFGAETSDLMLVRIGRGVGAGLITGGEPLIGSRCAAGEIGHVVVDTDQSPVCACGRRGCLEAWVNAPRLDAAIASDPSSAESVLSDAGVRLAVGIAPIVAALDLAEVVLAGPAELLNEQFLRAATDTLHARTLEGVFADVVIRRTRLADIVLRGAVVMVLSDQLGVS